MAASKLPRAAILLPWAAGTGLAVAVFRKITDFNSMLNNYNLPSASEGPASHFQTCPRQENGRTGFLCGEFLTLLLCIGVWEVFGVGVCVCVQADLEAGTQSSVCLQGSLHAL